MKLCLCCQNYDFIKVRSYASIAIQDTTHVCRDSVQVGVSDFVLSVCRN